VIRAQIFGANRIVWSMTRVKAFRDNTAEPPVLKRPEVRQAALAQCLFSSFCAEQHTPRYGTGAHLSDSDLHFPGASHSSTLYSFYPTRITYTGRRAEPLCPTLPDYEWIRNAPLKMQVERRL
jgi:hypothetical protein